MLIAQLSDLHALPGNDNLEALARVVDWLRQIRPDAAIVSGDLVDDGWTDGYREIDRILKHLDCLAFLLPGNSDSRAAMRSAFPHATYWTEPEAMHFGAPVGDTLIVGFDATVDGQNHGDCRPHLPWLEQTLSEASPRRPLMFLHQHVFPCGIDSLDDTMCRGSQDLAELFDRTSARPLAISSGHVHCPMSSMLGNIPAYVCGSICPQNPLMLAPDREPAVTDRRSILVFDIEGTRVVAHHISL
jgi:3',5'-cyclic-AMP phosphodiesterase